MAEFDDGDGMKATSAGDSFTRGPWPAAAVRCGNSPVGVVPGINRVGAAGVTVGWPGGARTNQALCSNQTNHVAELRTQATTRSIPSAIVADLKMADRGCGICGTDAGVNNSEAHSIYDSSWNKPLFRSACITSSGSSVMMRHVGCSQSAPADAQAQ